VLKKGLLIGINFRSGIKYNAIILFSSSFGLALGIITNHYNNIALPLLMVTGSEEDDSYGICSPYVAHRNLGICAA
jgi:hypothetical protein